MCVCVCVAELQTIAFPASYVNSVAVLTKETFYLTTCLGKLNCPEKEASSTTIMVAMNIDLFENLFLSRRENRCIDRNFIVLLTAFLDFSCSLYTCF